MKRTLSTIIATIFILVLSACKTDPTLDTCMQAMIEEQSNDACPEDMRTSLLEEFFESYTDQLPTSEFTLLVDPLTYVEGNVPSNDLIRFRFVLNNLSPENFDDHATELVDIAILLLQDIQDVTNSLQESSVKFVFTDNTSLDVINDYGYVVLNGVWMYSSEGQDDFEQWFLDMLELQDLEAMQYRIYVADDQLTINLNPISKTARLQYLLYTDGSTPEYNSVISSMRALLQSQAYDVEEIYAEF